AERDEDVLHRGGAPLAESEVVLARAALVAVTLDGHRHVRILLQPIGLLLQRLPRLRRDVGLVIGEEDAVAGGLVEVLLRARADAGLGRRRGGRSATSGAAGILRSSRAGGQEGDSREQT